MHVGLYAGFGGSVPLLPSPAMQSSQCSFAHLLIEFIITYTSCI